MKYIINITLIMLLLANFASAQSWLLLGNTPLGTDFLGSLSGNNQPVNIKNEDNYPIRFFTNTGATLTPLRMIIAGGGNVGIGTLTSPNYLLQQDVSGANANYHQFTNNSNTASGNGLLVGINSSGTAEFNMQDNKAMKLFTNGTSRVFIDNGAGSGSGYVGIGNNFVGPASRLHLNISTSSVDNYFQITTSVGARLPAS
jgi:hypothetical protein